MRLLVIAALVLLAGCSTTLQDRIADNDDAARDTLTRAQCLTTIGAHFRDANPLTISARNCACGGPCP